MPVADLPYRISRLANEGQYAYLSRPAVRIAKISSEDKPEKVAKPPSTFVPSHLRVLRNVTLCDGPSLWDAIAAKKLSTENSEPYSFYVKLRLFATRSMVLEYLSGPEVASFCSSTGTPIPTLTDEDMVIGESDYLSPQVIEITKQEYSKVILSRNDGTTLENLEELVCQMKGIDSLESLDLPKRGRRRKSAALASTPPDAPPVVAVAVKDAVYSQSDEDEAGGATTTASDRPAVPVEAKPRPKKKTKSTLRDQLALVQNTPSRVIDVSGFGDTMQHQRGKFLDRMRHTERISQCTSLPDLFPIVSDNFPAFERAMTALGGRYLSRIGEFKISQSKVEPKLHCS